jgi:Sortase domain
VPGGRRAPSSGTWARVALAVALGMVLVAGTIAVAGRGPGGAPSVPAAASTTPSSSGAPAELRGTELRATEVWLPTLGVRSPLVDLDVGADGALQPPADPDVAGWFVRGAAPGEPGPAVIAGHVDSRSGPAVFHRLDELAAGDRVEVARSDGRLFAYRVVTNESHPKNAFPTTRVYGPSPGPELRLITCGGDFDRRSRHYLDNVVVTAVPVT